jgi:RNA polymerase sigma-70 factor (sigma-E family)
MAEDVEFPVFVRTNSAALLRSAYLLTGDQSSAEDLVQDTFVRLYRNWHRVQSANSPLAYVRRSLTNNFVNSLRGKAGRELLVAEPPDRRDDLDIALRISDGELVRGLLNTLGPRQRAVLVLRFFHDLSDAQIAADLGCRTGTVRSIVSRALSALRAENARLDQPYPAAHTNGTSS